MDDRGRHPALLTWCAPPARSIDDADGCRLRPHWNGLYLARGEAVLSISLALMMHLDDQSSDASELIQFSEFHESSQSAREVGYCASYGLASIFDTVAMLVTALAIEETEVIASILILVEKLVRAIPGLLSVHTLRLIVVTAATISAKTYFDEIIADCATCLMRAGFSEVTPSRLRRLESAFADAVGWKLHVTRLTYTFYVFECARASDPNRCLRHRREGTCTTRRRRHVLPPNQALTRLRQAPSSPCPALQPHSETCTRIG